MKLTLVIVLDTHALSPKKLRQNFARAVRDAIQRARQRGRIDSAEAEELWRVIPDPERV
jgi:hypothetical protein